MAQSLSPHPAAVTARLSIAIVDDDEASRDSLACLLESLGAAVQSFGSGESFLFSRDRHRHGCVLLDIHMPGVDGIDVTRCIRRDGYRGPIVLFSGRLNPSVCAAAKDAGATAILPKPVPESMLLDILTLGVA